MATVRECLLAEFSCRKYDRGSSIFVGTYNNKYFYISFENLLDEDEGDADPKHEMGLNDDIMLYKNRLKSLDDTADAVCAYWGIDESYDDVSKGELAYDKCLEYVSRAMDRLASIMPIKNPLEIDLDKYRGDN